MTQFDTKTTFFHGKFNAFLKINYKGVKIQPIHKIFVYSRSLFKA
jgi:hypothetical protein